MVEWLVVQRGPSMTQPLLEYSTTWYVEQLPTVSRRGLSSGQDGCRRSRCCTFWNERTSGHAQGVSHAQASTRVLSHPTNSSRRGKLQYLRVFSFLAISGHAFDAFITRALSPALTTHIKPTLFYSFFQIQMPRTGGTQRMKARMPPVPTARKAPRRLPLPGAGAAGVAGRT